MSPRQLAFNAAQKAIKGAAEIRMVTPDVGESRPFTDLQGLVLGHWMTFLLFPEAAGQLRPSLPPFPGTGFGFDGSGWR